MTNGRLDDQPRPVFDEAEGFRHIDPKFHVGVTREIRHWAAMRSTDDLLTRYRGLARPLFWAAAVFAFVMAVLPHPPDIPGSPSDKVQHVAAFVTLALLGAWAYPRLSLLQLVLRLSLFGAFIELVQAIPVLHRDSDPLDWLADTIACGAVLLAIAWWRARTRPR